ncbi:Maltase A2 [Portunus trituberculatus]|uniref:Maltase A2 n=1 Tax=Portunus trituberculatus TaxID=210409 RepID=A0A5B7JAK9_PORTR|nr:Maltase A2 [Portunus trituberculatus]
MDKGVDGFRVDAVKHLFEVQDLSLDEPLTPGHLDPNDYNSLQHIYTSNQPQNLDLVREWRALLDKRSEK